MDVCCSLQIASYQGAMTNGGPTNAITIKTIKTNLREFIKNKIRNELNYNQRDKQSTVIFDKLINSREFLNAQRICVYLSTENEVNTVPILENAFNTKKHVYVPTYYKNEPMKMVKLRNMLDYAGLQKTSWNIRQPNYYDDTRENAMEMDEPIDMFIMPGVCFTKSGCRLGYGRGYYDTYLNNYFALFNRCDTKLVGLAFDEQIVSEDFDFPCEEHDVKLDKIISPDY